MPVAEMSQASLFPDRPTKRIEDSAAITCVDDAELALMELAWCNAVEQNCKLNVEQRMREMNEEMESLTSSALGDGTTLSKHRERLETAVLTWADKNRKQLCQGVKKSVELRNGTLKWRTAKDAVDWIEGYAQKDAVEKVGNEGGLIARLEALISKLDWFGIFTVKLAVNKSAAVKAVQKKQVSEERLEEIGLKFVTGEEYVTLEPAEFSRIGVPAGGTT